MARHGGGGSGGGRLAGGGRPPCPRLLLRPAVAEKAVKAAWYLLGVAPWGHSVQKLISDFPQKDQLPDLDAVAEKAVVLDRLYVPTRYPNGLPELTPEKSYFAADSQRAIDLARGVMESFAKWMEQWQ